MNVIQCWATSMERLFDQVYPHSTGAFPEQSAPLFLELVQTIFESIMKQKHLISGWMAANIYAEIKSIRFIRKHSQNTLNSSRRSRRVLLLISVLFTVNLTINADVLCQHCNRLSFQMSSRNVMQSTLRFLAFHLFGSLPKSTPDVTRKCQTWNTK